MARKIVEVCGAALAGLIFGIGLIVSGMTNPAKVQGFLDLSGQWDPSLALVMAGAIGVAFLPFRWLSRRGVSLSGTPIQGPISEKRITPALVIGSVLFGIGWGLGGFCPGPALVGLASAWSPAVLFCVGMFGGFLLFGLLPASNQA